MTNKETAVQILRRRAIEQRSKGHDGLAGLFEQNADKGEEHAKQYVEMMSMVGRAARRIRETEGW